MKNQRGRTTYFPKFNRVFDKMASESKTDSDVRTLLKTLIASKNVMEGEIAVLVETVYMGELIDADGFPRADVDIHAVVGQRQRLARLQNDHSALMGSIETALQQLHQQQRTDTAAASDATASDGAGSALGAAAAGSGGDGVDTEHEEHTAIVTAAVEEEPFAIVDEVFPGVCVICLRSLQQDVYGCGRSERRGGVQVVSLFFRGFFEMLVLRVCVLAQGCPGVCATARSHTTCAVLCCSMFVCTYVCMYA